MYDKKENYINKEDVNIHVCIVSKIIIIEKKSFNF